ncbi:MAG: ring-opening amidohydrolase [Reyranellaceae bacterium]
MTRETTGGRRARVLRLATAGPHDTAPLADAIARGAVDPASIVAIVGKTEGNGCVNDFTRGYATLALKLLLAEQLKCPLGDIERRVAIVMSGGTEGGLSPHLLVFTREAAPAAPPGAAKRLAIGIGLTRPFAPEEIGRAAQISATAETVAAAMRDAGIDCASDVHFVQIKCPLLTKERIEEAARRGAAVATGDTYHSMALSRGASALGVAVALGEVAAERATDEAICRDWSLHSGVASTSAGVELLRNEVVVLGNAAGWSGDLAIDHGVMRDAIDAASARAVLERLGGDFVALLAKAEAAPDGTIRGRRHTMLDDSDIHSTRHARALVGGVLAGVVGDTMLYVSGGAEHQGPAGGGPVAIIARVGEADELSE